MVSSFPQLLSREAERLEQAAWSKSSPVAAADEVKRIPDQLQQLSVGWNEHEKRCKLSSPRFSNDGVRVNGTRLTESVLHPQVVLFSSFRMQKPSRLARKIQVWPYSAGQSSLSNLSGDKHSSSPAARGGEHPSILMSNSSPTLDDSFVHV